MNRLRNVMREFMGFPRLMQIGFVVLAIGGGLDMAYHLSPAAWLKTFELFLGRDGYYAHLVTLAGMLITIAGLFAAQIVRHQTRP